MGLFSSIGGILGGIGGAILAPFTGGASIPIGAGLGSAIGGAADSNKANKTAQGYYNQQMDFAKEQFQFQQDYAKNVAQWRVEDAKKAGLHPMAALGISSPSYSPVSAPSSPSYSTGTDIDPMEFGQSLNYAATKAKESKTQETMVGLQIRGLELDNEMKQAQIDQMKVDTLASSIASNQALRSPAAPSVNATSPVNTGLISPEGSAYHVWNMGNGNYDILMNPDYQQTIGDEFGQLFTTYQAIKRAGHGVFINPEDGRSYVFNPDTGYFNLLSALSPEEAAGLLGNGVSSSSGSPVNSSHRERNRYRYRY